MSQYFHNYEYMNRCVLEIMHDNLNIFNTAEVHDVFKKALANAGPRGMIVDLKNVTHVDSVGIGFLIAVKNMSVKQRCDIVLVCSNELVLKVMKITRMENFYRIFGSLDEAVKWIENKDIV
ncbi:MAG: STAS domain-containing protein [Smithella sp.]|nr:STAS domain-containing protein [Smithella sp.]